MTPNDADSRLNRMPTMFDEADEVHVSVVFAWDRPRAERLAKQWSAVAPVKVGGPAYGDKGGEFIPGRYVAPGNVITHRGCPNNCWFCDAWKREGREVRELPITEGWNLLDNNIFACSLEHQEKVFQMLLRQPTKTRLTGGLEAARLTKWQVEWLVKLKPETLYFAYDEPSDYEPLREAATLLSEYGLFVGHSVGCYVLIGYPKDTLRAANERLIATASLGYMPQSMLLNKGADIKDDSERKKWISFNREWANKVIVGSKMKNIRETA